MMARNQTLYSCGGSGGGGGYGGRGGGSVGCIDTTSN